MSIDHIHLPEFVERKADADINRCREQTMMSRNWLPNLDSPASQEKTWFIVRWNSYRLYMFAKAKWQFHTCSCCFLFDDQVLAPFCSYCGVMNLGRVVGFIFLSWSLNRLLEMLLVALTFGAGGGTFFLCCDLTLWLNLHCIVSINNFSSNWMHKNIIIWIVLIHYVPGSIVILQSGLVLQRYYYFPQRS